MNLESLQIKNFRTIVDAKIDLAQGLSIVGTNNSGKSNILKAIEMIFTGFENKFDYKYESDLTFNSIGTQTTFIATFSGDRVKLDNEFFQAYDELNNMLETPKPIDGKINLYLSFSKKSKPTYSFFHNEKRNPHYSSDFPEKQITVIEKLLHGFVCHYIPSIKNINHLYSSLLLPLIKKPIAKVLSSKRDQILESLDEIAKKIDEQLIISGLSHIKSHFLLPQNSLEKLIDEFEFHLSDPNQTAIDKKGMGIQISAILASFLWITREEKKSNKNTIWLIEEPESYLHPSLATNCNEMLNRIKSEALLITTTHSLSFVNQDSTKVIGTELNDQKTKITLYRNYVDATKLIRNSLGIKFSDYYNLGLFNIFVEGESDREIFQWFLNKENKSTWSYVRQAQFLDFTGVTALEGFMRATYEFIFKERSVVVIFDGDEAGNKTIRNLQNYFGGKNGISFEANKNFVSIHNGFTIEGLFPHNWITEAYNQNKSWFKTYSVDVKNNLKPFEIHDNNKKKQLQHYLMNKADQVPIEEWSERFLDIFNVVDKGLELNNERINRENSNSFEEQKSGVESIVSNDTKENEKIIGLIINEWSKNKNSHEWANIITVKNELNKNSNSSNTFQTKDLLKIFNDYPNIFEKSKNNTEFKKIN